MDISAFVDLVDSGVRPVIEFEDGILESDGYAEVGMRAEVVAACQMDGGLRVEVDYGRFESHNKSLEKANYYDRSGCPCLTARDAGLYTVRDHYWVPSVEGSFHFVETDSLKLYDEYLASCTGNMPYVSWLESSLTEARG